LVKCSSSVSTASLVMLSVPIWPMWHRAERSDSETTSRS
jgi:hypothetical protein